jgi:hypothetical protein
VETGAATRGEGGHLTHVPIIHAGVADRGLGLSRWWAGTAARTVEA